MRIDIEGDKYTYIFEDGRARLLRYGEPTGRDVVGDKLIYCMAAEISELRQQVTRLTNLLEMIEHATAPSHDDGAFHENAYSLASMAFNAQLQDENARLRQHLDGNPIEAARQTGYMAGHASRDDEFAELRQQVTLMREPLLYIDEVAKTSKTIMSVAAAAMKMLKKIRAALAATEPKKLGGN